MKRQLTTGIVRNLVTFPWAKRTLRGNHNARRKTRLRCFGESFAARIREATSGLKLVIKGKTKMFCAACGAADQLRTLTASDVANGTDKKSFGGRGASKPEQRLTTMIVFNGLSGLLALFSLIALYATYLNTPEAKWSCMRQELVAV